MRELSDQEKDAIYAEVRAALPEIERTVTKLKRAIGKLSDVGQKHAVTLFLADWIADRMDDDAQLSISFSKHLLDEVEKVLLGSQFPAGVPH